MEDLAIKIDGKEYNVKVEDTEDGKIKVYCGGDVYFIETKKKVREEVEGGIKKKHSKESGNNIVAPLPGTIVAINVKKGDKVSSGETLIKLVAMKMENEITAPKDGRVKDIKVKKNDNVNRGDLLVILE